MDCNNDNIGSDCSWWCDGLCEHEETCGEPEKAQPLKPGEHTPGPWETEGNASDAPDPRWQIFNESIILAVTCGGNDQANAEYIVRACNSHKDLLGLVKRIKRHLDGGGSIQPENGIHIAIVKAIKKAKAQP